MENRALKTIFAIVLIFVTVFLNSEKKDKFDISNLKEFMVGDLIFRHGDTVDSIIISQKSDFKYSHVGIVVQINPVLIIHATTDEDSQKSDQVLINTLDEFLSHATDFAIARFEFLDTNQKILFANSLKKRVGERFVLASRELKNLYCTTLIENELSKIVNFTPKYTQINTPLFEGSYLFPKAIWEYEGVKTVYENKK